MYSDNAKEEIKARIDIVDLIRSYVPLRKAGTVWKACCPFHQEKTPSFTVDPIRGTYHCFGCGEHGDIFTFTMKQGSMTFPEALRELAQRAGVILQEDANPVERAKRQRRARLYSIYEELAAFYQRCLALKSAQIARDYLAERHIPAEIATQFRLGYAPKRRNALLEWGHKHGYTTEELIEAQVLIPPKYGRDDDFYDRFHGRLVFPIRDKRGRICAFSARILDGSHPAKYVNSPETEIFKKSHILYALSDAIRPLAQSPQHQAIVCEGQIDVIRCHSAGFTTAVASQGTAFTEDHVKLLKESGAESAVLVFDGDSAGRKAAIRTGKLFLGHGIPVMVATLPLGEDPDSLIRDKGAEAFQGILDGAESLVAFIVHSAARLEKQPESIDALTRTTAQILEVLQNTESAVMRARLQQEAAALLGVSEDALEEDFKKVLQEVEARRPQRLQESTAEDLEFLEEPDIVDFDDVEPVEEPLEASPAASTASSLADALAELVLHHYDNQPLLEDVRHCLPPNLIPDGPVRSLVNAIHQTPSQSPFQLPDELPEYRAYYDEVLERDERLGSETAPQEALEELIRKFWIQATEQQGKVLPADNLKRLELQKHIGYLKSAPWRQVRATLSGNYEPSQPEPSPPPTAPAPLSSEPFLPSAPLSPPQSPSFNEPSYLPD